MWAFHAKHQKQQYVMARKRKGEILQKAIQEFLEAGIEIVQDFSINAWDNNERVPTLQKVSDTPSDYDALLKYVRIPDRGGIRQGETNHNWGMNATCGIPLEHFLAYWDELKPYRKNERITTVFQQIRATPLQANEWHDTGWFVGATNKQYMEENIAHIQQQFPDVTVGINWQGIQFNRVSEHWKHAERTHKRNRDNAERAKLSPTSFQVLVSKKSHVSEVMAYLYTHHGKLGENGSWPSMPDGSKLRFTPHFQYLKDHKGRSAINRRMALHIQMKWTNQMIDTTIKNPGLKLPCLKDKSIGHILLEYEHESDGQKEPYFRHFSKVWNRDPTVEKWEICVHQHMYKEAKKQYPLIIQDIGEKYGTEVYEAFRNGIDCTYTYANNNQQNDERITFDLDDDDDDMYMSGKGNFQFQGIPEVVNSDNNRRSQLQQMQDDAASSIGFSVNEKNPGTQHNQGQHNTEWTTVRSRSSRTNDTNTTETPEENQGRR